MVTQTHEQNPNLPAKTGRGLFRKKIPVGVSSCLLGENVRYDGGHKRDAYIVNSLAEFFEFHPVCPEVAIGMGIPRPSIHLAQTGQSVRSVGVNDPALDVTERLQAYAERQKFHHAGLCGYILKKDSPSCGMERVKVLNGGRIRHDGVGVYAQVLMRNNPLLPVEDEMRLGNPGLRENFIQRVYVLHRWRRLWAAGLTPQTLIAFHDSHELGIMSHTDYRDLRRLLAGVTAANLPEVAECYISQLMVFLKRAWL